MLLIPAGIPTKSSPTAPVSARGIQHIRTIQQINIRIPFPPPRCIRYQGPQARKAFTLNFPNDAMTLIRIAEYFDVSVDYLLEMTDRRKEDARKSPGYSQNLTQLIQLYNAATEHEKGRILQFAMDLSDKDLHKK